MLASVLWIRIRMDPHSFGCHGFGSVLGMRIRIQDMEIDPDLQTVLRIRIRDPVPF
jgi:hypothetical protein